MVKIAGNNLSEYVFAINIGDTYAINAIKGVRNQIFKKNGVYLKTVTSNKLEDGQKAYDIKVLSMLTRGGWGVEDIRGDYKSVLEQKRGYLEDLIGWFESASD